MADKDKSSRTSGGGNLPLVGVSAARSGDALRKRPVRHPVGKFNYIAQDSRHVVRFGEISETEATDVFKHALSEWGLKESSENQRAELLGPLSHALVVSTSKGEENLDTRFEYDGRMLCVRPIHDAVVSLSSTNNDSGLRVFARSYNGAELAVRMHDFLKDAANSGERQELALRCGGPTEDAPYMLDVMDAVVRHSGRVFTFNELDKINKYRANRTGAARVRAQDVGAITTRPDTANRVQTVGGNNGTGELPIKPAEARLNLTRLR